MAPQSHADSSRLPRLGRKSYCRGTSPTCKLEEGECQGQAAWKNPPDSLPSQLQESCSVSRS